MVGKELSLITQKESAQIDIREIAAKTTLRQVRQKGHPYVELRKDGKRIIFFCNLCLTPCYNDNVLFDHLRGNLHKRQLTAAKVTLLGPVPWPFNDGVLFFNNSREENNNNNNSNGENGNCEHGSQSKALVVHSQSVENLKPNGLKSNGNSAKYGKKGKVKLAVSKNRKNNNYNSLIVPRVLVKESVYDIGVHLLGIGNISYRVSELDEIKSKITKIWCEWNGQNIENTLNNNNIINNKCDFAIVNFGYSFDLGRKWDENQITNPNSIFLIEDSGKKIKKRKKSFSDQEASSEESQNSKEKEGETQIRVYDSREKETQIRVYDSREKEMQIRVLDERWELRKHKRIDAERACDICGQKMLPGKDVGALFNLKTRVLACSSRNSNGAFHLFHASCLVHWILMCEYEITSDKINNPKGHRGRKPKAVIKNQISSVLCPECQGTGTHLQNDQFEKPTVSLSEMFKYKLKIIEAHKAWMKNPEILNNCSTGLYFPLDSIENNQEKVVPLKQMHFYRADE